MISCALLLLEVFRPDVVMPSRADDLKKVKLDPRAGWRETPPIRVIMKSTADWARIMFDDELGNNTNGIRFKYVVSYGWLKGNDNDDEITVGKTTWIDVLYNMTVKKTGDIIEFNKQRDDFDYTEMYADIIFETDLYMTSGYFWLMLAGQGTTTFQLMSLESKSAIWEETLTGTGYTSHVKRYIMLDSFFRKWEISPISIAFLALIVILVMVLLGPLIPQRTGTPRNREKRRDRSAHAPSWADIGQEAGFPLRSSFRRFGMFPV